MVIASGAMPVPCVSRNTVAKVAKATSDHQLSKDALESMEEKEIHNTLFPEEALLPTLLTPDFPYIHKELLKSDVTLKLLWQESVDTCRNAEKPPYGYSPILQAISGLCPKKVMKQFQKLPLVILDEFLLIPASDQEQRDLLELMEYRCGQASTIFCSQFMSEGWHERLGGSAFADSILDRIIPSAYTMRIDGDVPMRQRKRVIKN